MDAIACTPPRVMTTSAPAGSKAYSRQGCMGAPGNGPEQAMIVSTPAALGVPPPMEAGHIDRYHPLPCGHAWMQRHRELMQRLALRQRKIAHLRNRKIDVAAHLRRHLGAAAPDLDARDNQIH